MFSLLMLTFFGLLRVLLVYIDPYLATFIAQNLSARLRENLFDHLQRLTLDWHDKQKKGDLVQRLTGNIADIEKLVNDGLVDLLAGILTLAGVAIVMSFISKPYTMLSLIIAPILFLLVLGYTSGIKAATKKKAKAAGKLGDVATEDIQALTVIRAYTLEKRENKRFGLHVGSYRSAGMRVGRLRAQFTPLVSVLVVFGTIFVVGIGGYVAAGNVFFGYTKERTVLKGINLHIPAGRKVALVGYSGSGKTTLVKLIPRFYQLERGAIKIDGVENSQYPPHVLRQNISMALQDSILFEGTIRENLEIGRPGSSMKLIIDAAKKANIHEMIMDMPDGYDTYVREQGNNLSAGQRQRLSIARAILRNSPILILDEPTANLDVEAEPEVMHALNSLIVGRTVLTISHRLSTLGNVDEILVLQYGQIVERGTFKELKRNNGAFANLLKEQNRYTATHGSFNTRYFLTHAGK